MAGSVQKLSNNVKKLLTMDVSDTLNPPASHILKARKIAQELFKYSPEEQIEMLKTIKDNIIQFSTMHVEQIKKM